MSTITHLLSQALQAYRLPNDLALIDHGPWVCDHGQLWRTTLTCRHAQNGAAHQLEASARVADGHLDLQVLDGLGFGVLGQAGHNEALARKAAVAAEHETSVWTDPNNGLMWMREALSGLHAWDEAMALPESFNVRGGCTGYTDWRVPTIDELNALITKPDQEGRPFRADMFLDMAGAYELGRWPALVYWSASPDVERSDLAWCVGFRYGRSGRDLKTSPCGKVRLVRG